MELKAPCVCFNNARHSCIVVKATPRHVYAIPMDAGGIELKEFSHGKFLEQFKVSDYLVDRAAAQYLAAGKIIVISPAAKNQLKELVPNGYRLDIPLQAIEAAATELKRQQQDNAAPTHNHARKEVQMATAKKAATAADTKSKKSTPAKAAPAKESKKPAAKAEAKETSGRKPGVGAFIRELLLKGKETEEILMAVREKFPESKAGPSDVSWNRSKLKAAGQL